MKQDDMVRDLRSPPVKGYRLKIVEFRRNNTDSCLFGKPCEKLIAKLPIEVSDNTT